MAVELGKAAPTPLDFELNGRQVSTRKLPFRLAMSLHSEDGTITAEMMADILQACVVYTDDKTPVWDDAAEILDLDTDVVIELFSQVSAGISTVDARKNSKASR